MRMPRPCCTIASAVPSTPVNTVVRLLVLSYSLAQANEKLKEMQSGRHERMRQEDVHQVSEAEELRKAAAAEELRIVAEVRRRPRGVARPAPEQLSHAGYAAEMHPRCGRDAPEQPSHAASLRFSPYLVLLRLNPFYPLTLMPEETDVASRRGFDRGGCADETTRAWERAAPPATQPTEPMADVPIAPAPPTAPDGRRWHPAW